MGAAIAAVIVARERETVDAFRDSGAISPDSALPLGQVGVDDDGLGFRRLHRHAVIREAAPGRYYLDDEVWAAVRNTRRRLMLTMLAIVAIAAAGVATGFLTLT